VGKPVRTLLSIVFLVGLIVAAGVYAKLKLDESRRAPMPADFEEKLRQDNRVAEGVVALAEARALLKDSPDEAVRRLRAFIKDSPASPEASEASLILAEALGKEGSTQEAVALFDAVIADPHAGVRRSRARVLRARVKASTDPAAARGDLQAVLGDDEHPPAIQNQARLELGLLEVKAGEFTRAMAVLTPLTQRNYPERAAAYDAIRQAVAGQAQKLAAGGNAAALLAWSEEMVKRFPDVAGMADDIHLHQAAALGTLGRFAEARVLLERLRRPPEVADREKACTEELQKITEAEAAAGIVRTRDAFLKAKADGKETRASFEGDIAADATWAGGKGPLVLTGKVTVKPGAVLTLEPGCVVQFVQGARLVVEGALIARGTADSPIRFTSVLTKDATPFDGEGIFFADSSADDRCTLEHCVVEYQRVGVACAASSPTLRQCVLARNGNAGLLATDGAEPRIEEACRIESNDSAGLQAEGANVSVRRCLILRNGGEGIRLANKAKGTIEGCRIQGNGRAGIACDNMASPTLQGNDVAANQGDGIACNRFSQPVIQGNVVRDNRGTGIRATLDSAATITGNLIEGNHDHPMILERSDGVIKGNTLVRNRPYGLNCAKSASPTIEGNWIEGNGAAGIICGEASAPTITRNAILGQAKAISNTGTLTVQAKENYFGDVGDAAMGGLIFDKHNEQALGEVIWAPRLTVPPPRPATPTLDLPPLP